MQVKAQVQNGYVTFLPPPHIFSIGQLSSIINCLYKSLDLQPYFYQLIDGILFSSPLFFLPFDSNHCRI
jgi:hypothetical protein